VIPKCKTVEELLREYLSPHGNDRRGKGNNLGILQENVRDDDRLLSGADPV